MTKKIGVLLIGVAILVAIFFISTRNSDGKVTKKDDSQKNKQVEILVKKNIYKLGTNAIEYELLNNSEKELTCGERYELKFLDNGSWVDLNLDMCFDDAEYNIKPKQKRSFKFHLLPDQFDYAEGKYRFTKKVTVGEKSITLAFDFELEK